MPEWFGAICIIIAWANGVMLGGALWASGPFWDGVRTVYRFGRPGAAHHE